jgi:hypothetical protein
MRPRLSLHHNDAALCGSGSTVAFLAFNLFEYYAVYINNMKTVPDTQEEIFMNSYLPT